MLDNLHAEYVDNEDSEDGGSKAKATLKKGLKNRGYIKKAFQACGL
jgi:hypothetical protein